MLAFDITVHTSQPAVNARTANVKNRHSLCPRLSNSNAELKCGEPYPVTSFCYTQHRRCSLIWNALAAASTIPRIVRSRCARKMAGFCMHGMMWRRSNARSPRLAWRDERSRMLTGRQPTSVAAGGLPCLNFFRQTARRRAVAGLAFRRCRAATHPPARPARRDHPDGYGPRS